MSVPSIAITAPTGPAGAPLIVLGPSLGTSTILWDDTAAILKQHFRVRAWDLPGHGFSPAATGSFTLAELARAVLDAVDERQFFYAGVSLGGAVGLEMLLAEPDRIGAASIVCAGAKIGTSQGWTERAAVVRAQGTASLVVASAQRWFAPGSMERHPEISGRLLHSLRDADDESYALCAEALADYDVRGRLGEIRMPVLAVWGQYDAVTPRADSDEIATGVQNGRAVEITDAAHLAPAEEPAAVASALMAHFKETT